MGRMLRPATCAVLGGLLSLSALQQKPDRAAPNIIYIMADDLGYGELGSYGQTKIRTPRLDRMAAEGMRFTQFYAGSTVCAPSRGTLLTGVHTGHAYVRDNQELGGFLDEEERGQIALPPDTHTLARALSTRGYTTAIIGKWGLGGPDSTGVPTRQGFNLFFGYLDQKQAHNFYPTHLWRNEERYPLRNPYFSPHQIHKGDPNDPAAYRQYRGTDYAIDFMTREATAFIEANRNKPFFLYFAPTLPHVSLQVPETALAEYAGAFPETPYLGEKRYLPHRTPRAAYAAMITYLDAQVGALLDTVKTAGLDEKTIVFFTSDNGATFDAGGAPTAFFNSNGDLRGHKQDLYEGGIRVPMIVRWPGRIANGTTSDHVAANWDVWATLSELTGAPSGEKSDGISMLPALLGSPKGRQHEFLYWEYHSQGGAQAVRMGRWKGIRNNAKANPNGPIELYDLAADPAEKTDVSSAHADIVRRIVEIMGASHTPAALQKWNFVSDARRQKTAQPNILFAIADDWSFGHAGAYGSTWVRTPAFDRVAREGVLFTHAYTPNAKCAPSRAILLTGRHSWQLEEAANHVPFFPQKFKTWFEALGEHGYVTGMTGKGWGPGVANDAQSKPRLMTGRPFQHHTSQAPTRDISNVDYAANLAAFLATVPRDLPWSFWYGAHEPHRAYEYGSGVSKGGKRLSDVERVPGYWPDNDIVRNDMLDYAYEVEHFDRHLDRMLKTLSDAGTLDNTIVIVTSDHGMPFPRVKGQAYEFSNHVPLAMMWRAGITPSGRVVSDYISFVDLAPTLVELAGLQWEDTGMQPAAGRSLSDILRLQPSRPAARDHLLVGKERHDVGRPHDWGYPIRGIIAEDTLYLRNYEPARWPAGNPETGYLNCDGSPTKTEILRRRRDGSDTRAWALAFGLRPREELYDLKRDPLCLTNLAVDLQRRPQLQRLRQQMEGELRAQHDPRQFGRGDVFDRYIYADEGTRNFYERFMRGEKLRAGWVNASDFEPSAITHR